MAESESERQERRQRASEAQAAARAAEAAAPQPPNKKRPFGAPVIDRSAFSRPESIFQIAISVRTSGGANRYIPLGEMTRKHWALKEAECTRQHPTDPKKLEFYKTMQSLVAEGRRTSECVTPEQVTEAMHR